MRSYRTATEQMNGTNNTNNNQLVDYRDIIKPDANNKNNINNNNNNNYLISSAFQSNNKNQFKNDLFNNKTIDDLTGNDSHIINRITPTMDLVVP